MLNVKLFNEKELELSFIYNDDYRWKIKKINGSYFNPTTKSWIIPRYELNTLIESFKDEIMWVTPKYLITGEKPPSYDSIYKVVPNLEYKVKEPYSLYNYQKFGANFLVHYARKYGFSMLLDDMGTG